MPGLHLLACCCVLFAACAAGCGEDKSVTYTYTTTGDQTDGGTGVTGEDPTGADTTGTGGSETGDGAPGTDTDTDDDGGGVTEIPTTTGDECGPIGSVGCCDEEVLKYCKQGKLQAYDCTVGKPPHCGWDQDFYNCEQESSEDPSGKAPKACP